MFNITEYYADIREWGARLDGDGWRRSSKPIWIYPLRGCGEPIMATPAVAAMHLRGEQAPTHRLATEAEIAQELERQRIVREINLAEDRERKGKNAPPMSPEMVIVMKSLEALLGREAARAALDAAQESHARETAGTVQHRSKGANN